MDLAAESAPAPTQALFLLTSTFFDPPAAHIWARTAVLSGLTAAMSRLLSELFEHVGPSTVLFPACVALEDTVPLAISVWQFTPLGAAAQYPVNCLYETATLFLLPCIGTRVSLQKSVKFLPLLVGNSLCRHPALVANVTVRIERQRDLVPCSIPANSLYALRSPRHPGEDSHEVPACGTEGG